MFVIFHTTEFCPIQSKLDGTNNKKQLKERYMCGGYVKDGGSSAARKVQISFPFEMTFITPTKLIKIVISLRCEHVVQISVQTITINDTHLRCHYEIKSVSKSNMKSALGKNYEGFTTLTLTTFAPRSIFYTYQMTLTLTLTLILTLTQPYLILTLTLYL